MHLNSIAITLGLCSANVLAFPRPIEAADTGVAGFNIDDSLGEPGFLGIRNDKIDMSQDYNLGGSGFLGIRSGNANIQKADENQDDSLDGLGSLGIRGEVIGNGKVEVIQDDSLGGPGFVGKRKGVSTQ